MLLLEILDLIALEDARAINITSCNSRKENDRDQVGRHQRNGGDELERYQTGRENIPRDLARMSFFPRVGKDEVWAAVSVPSFFLAG